MVRPKGFNQATTLAIVKVLMKYPEGTWIRRIAREAKLHPTTVSRYTQGVLAPAIESSALGQKPILTVVRLKPMVFDKLSQGLEFGQVLRVLNLIDQASK